jgi:hypothetical protein
MAGATIRIFLTDGTPLGPRIIEKSNWTGRAFDFPRTGWGTFRSRDDFGKPGVYVLAGVEADGNPRVYVGEADELRTRINQQATGPGAKDFWTRAVAFISKDENLNKAHVRFLESRLVGLAAVAKRAKLENANVPAAPALSEYDRAEAEAFLAEMLVIYPLLGIDAFNPPTPTTTQVTVLYLKARGVAAIGRDTPEGFVVSKGSEAAATETPSLHAYIRAQRATLIANGVLASDGGRFRVTQDYTFNSPSTAAAALLGRASNGRTEWKDATGVTLKEIQEGAAL